MRIAFLVHQYGPHEVGGTELYTAGLARRALRDGDDVVVIAGREDPSADPASWTTSDERVDGVRVRRLSRNLSVAPSVVGWEHDDPETGARVARLLAADPPDLVHVTHGLRLGASAIEACHTLGIPSVVTLTDFWFLCPRHTLLRPDGATCAGPTDPDACLECVGDLHGIAPTPTARAVLAARPARMRRALDGATSIVALSRFQRDVHLTHGHDPARMRVLPHGIETDGLDITPRPGPRTRLVCVAHLVPHKGQDLAVAALRARPDLEAELVLVGAPGADGEYVAHLRDAAAADPRIRIEDPVPRSRLGEVYAGADALVLPARWYENDPLVVKEALHIGLPVLASRIGSLAEQVRDGVDGITVDPEDVAGWGRAFAAVAANRRRGPGRPQPTAEETYAATRAIWEEAIA